MADDKESLAVELQKKLKLPEGYEYSNFKITTKEQQFHCNVLENEQDIKAWVKKFCELSWVEWRISGTYPKVQGVKCCFRLDYRCQHSKSRHHVKRKRISKDIQCPAQMIIKIIRLSHYFKNRATEITLRYEHNHDIGITDISFKYRDVSSKTLETLRHLFSRGHSPFGAHQILQTDAFMQFGEDYHKIANDRSHIPDIAYCYNLFYKEFKPEVGPIRAIKKLDYTNLKNKLDEWRIESGAYAATEIFNDEIIVCIVTPLMKRVHSKIVQSKKLMFLDSNSQCDRTKYKIYFLSTDSIAGNLPIGYIITSSDKKEIFERALQQFALLDADQTFFSESGSLAGPSHIVSDMDFTENDVFENIWPSSTLLFSTRDVLRTVWQWITAKSNNIHINNRGTLFLAFKKILTAKNNEEMLQCYDELKISDAGKKSINFCNYIEVTWWPSIESWCLCFRQMLVANCYESDCAEYALRAVKDIFLKRTKSYNIAQLVDLITMRCDQYYSQRITDFISGKITSSQMERFIPESDVSFDQIADLGSNNYLIKYADEEDYLVDVQLGFCTCSVGMYGSFCKHQFSVVLYKVKDLDDVPNMYTEDLYQTLFYVSSGEEAVNEMAMETDNLIDSNYQDLAEVIVINVESDETVDNQKVNLLDNYTDVQEKNLVEDNVKEVSTSSAAPEQSITQKKTTTIIVEGNRASNYENVDYFQDLLNIFNHILDRVELNQSAEMKKAAEDFCRNYRVFCKNDNLLQFALATFGKTGVFNHYCVKKEDDDDELST